MFGRRDFVGLGNGTSEQCQQKEGCQPDGTVNDILCGMDNHQVYVCLEQDYDKTALHDTFVWRNASSVSPYRDENAALCALGMFVNGWKN